MRGNQGGGRKAASDVMGSTIFLVRRCARIRRESRMLLDAAQKVKQKIAKFLPWWKGEAEESVPYGI